MALILSRNWINQWFLFFFFTQPIKSKVPVSQLVDVNKWWKDSSIVNNQSNTMRPYDNPRSRGPFSKYLHVGWNKPCLRDVYLFQELDKKKNTTSGTQGTSWCKLIKGNIYHCKLKIPVYLCSTIEAFRQSSTLLKAVEKSLFIFRCDICNLTRLQYLLQPGWLTW